jgi:hypothetical protein
MRQCAGVTIRQGPKAVVKRLGDTLARQSGGFIGGWALAWAFVTYFCMYAFRKPFTAGAYDHVIGWPFALDFKACLILCQVLGYALSKALGIKLVAEAGDKGRGWLVLGLIVFSELSLVLFAMLPPALKPVAMFMNGLPLGMVWSVVLRYLEGRRTSEFLGAGLCTSFILASGVVKSVGQWVLVEGIASEEWMPALTGLLFLPLTALAIALLAQTPPPDEADISERQERAPMHKADRQAFFRQYRLQLLSLAGSFVMLAIIRDFRDNFAVEIWRATGYSKVPGLMALSEVPAALLVLAMLVWMGRVNDNARAVSRIHVAMLGGVGLAMMATILYQLEAINAVVWMILLGAGIYLGYVPCTSILADRLIAALKSKGNTAYLVNLFDTWAYMGSVALLLLKAFSPPHLAWLPVFKTLVYVGLLIGFLGISASYRLFRAAAKA